MLLPHRCQHSSYKLLETLGSDTQLLLGWSEGQENAREPEPQLHWAPHADKVTNSRSLTEQPSAAPKQRRRFWVSTPGRLGTSGSGESRKRRVQERFRGAESGPVKRA